MVILHIGMDSIGTTKRNLLNPDELIQLDNVKSIILYLAPKETAGLATFVVKANNLLP